MWFLFYFNFLDSYVLLTMVLLWLVSRGVFYFTFIIIILLSFYIFFKICDIEKLMKFSKKLGKFNSWPWILLMKKMKKNSPFCQKLIKKLLGETKNIVKLWVYFFGSLMEPLEAFFFSFFLNKFLQVEIYNKTTTMI
jgi:hypothetical protein